MLKSFFGATSRLPDVCDGTGGATVALAGSSKLTVFHQNTQCLSENKVARYEIFFSSYNCDVFCVTEHWYRKNEIDTLTLQGFYVLDHFSRQNYQHGGVAIFCKNHIKGRAIHEVKRFAEELHFECAAGRFTISDTNLIVLVVYRSSGLGDRVVFANKLVEVLDFLTEKFKRYQIILCGDFNCDFLAPSGALDELTDILNTFYLHATIEEPTRGPRCLDNICVSNDLVCDSSVLPNGLSDHAAQSVFIHLKEGVNCREKLAFRQLNKPENIRHFKELLASASWDVVGYDAVNVNTQYLRFHEVVTQCFEAAFPLRTKYAGTRSGGNDKSWVTRGIRTSSRRLKDLYRLAQDGGEAFKQHYKLYKKTYDRVIMAAKRRHFSDRIANSANKSKTAWEIIGKGKIKQKPIELEVDTGITCDPLECARHCNVYFNEVTDLLVDDSAGFGNIDVPRTVNTRGSFCFFPVTETEVSAAIHKLKASQSSGFDGVSSRLLKYCKEEVCSPLAAIINSSFCSGTFPELLKTSKIIPLYKKGPTEKVESYRPISLVSTFSKIIEKIVSERLVGWLNKHSLFNPNQHGFRKNRSTVTALLNFLNKLYNELDKGNSCVGLFLDLSKAFDLVDYSILCGRLCALGVRGVALDWFHSYLEERRHFVEIAGVRSDTLVMKRGVPQGSVLGPLLYILYVVDLEEPDAVLFADDTSILVTAKSLLDVTHRANASIKNVDTYFRDNKLCLNVNKCASLLFNGTGRTREVNKLDVTLGDNIIRSVESSVFLGVCLDAGLKWLCHVDHVCSRVSSMCYALKRLRHYVSVDVLRSYYFAVVHSVMSYGIVVWGSSRGLERVFKLQKRALRFMVGVTSRTSCKNLFRQQKIMTIPGVYIYNALLLAREGHGFKKLGCNCNYNTRNDMLLEVPRHNTAFFENSPRYKAITLYNNLPKNIKSLPLNVFKKEVKKLLIEKSYYKVQEYLGDGDVSK